MGVEPVASTSDVPKRLLLPSFMYEVCPCPKSFSFTALAMPMFFRSMKQVSVLFPDRRNLSPNVRVFVEWVTGLFEQKKS